MIRFLYARGNPPTEIRKEEIRKETHELMIKMS